MKLRERTFLTNATVIELRGEKHVLTTVQDITAQKTVEEALRAADRMKDEFLATLSHELRTPLTSIIGWSEMLLRGEFDEEERRTGLQSIRASARAQAQLIEDLLDVSRIVAGKVRLQRQAVDLASIIEAAVAAIRPAAEAKGIPLQVTIDDGLPRSFADRDRLQQVVWNLLSNSMKFSSRGESVRVELRQENGGAVIEVIDRGRGIARDFLPHVFERFRQADSSSKRTEAGLGLGLALVKELVELHGGTIEAESEEGRGSRFRVHLPFGESARSAAHDGVEAAAQGSQAALLAGMRVLYVDDREDARLLIRMMLAPHGVEVIQASSANDAMAALSREQPHVVVTDLAMPGRDGYDLLAMIRADSRWHRLPVLALTANVRTDEQRRAGAAGFHAFLRKPIESHELAVALARAAASVSAASS